MLTSAIPRRLDLGGGVELRAVTAEDLPVIVATVNANLDHLRPWMPWAQEPATEQSQGEWLALAEAGWREGTAFQYSLRAGESYVGGIGLHTRRGPGVLEIGYWIRADAQRRGLVTAAARALTVVALRDAGADRVEICCDEANTRSAAVPQRLGFTLAGVEEREIAAAGETGRHQVWVAGAEWQSRPDDA